MRLAAILVLALLAPEAPALAHADIEERLQEVEAALAETPDDPHLYLKRGELHRRHQDPAAAAADYDRAEALAPGLAEVDFLRGRLFLEFGQPGAALALFDRHIAALPDYPDAYILRARARLATGDRVGAVADFDRAIALLPSPTPELYRERAALQQGAAALAGLDEGIARLGPVVTLVRAVVDVAVRDGQPEAGLARLELLPAALLATPLWLTRRGDLLAGDPGSGGGAGGETGGPFGELRPGFQ
jgi:tetratricopeptide (TPR) repeat protein